MLRRVLATCGNADCGRLGHGAKQSSVEIPQVVRALLDLQVHSASAGGAHTAVVTSDGTVLTFGLNDHGQLGHSGAETEVGLPQEVALPERAVAVAAGHYHTLCLSESGNVWAWGSDSQGQLGLGSSGPSKATEPRLITSLQNAKIVGLAAGAAHSLAVTASGEVYSWGSGDAGRLGHGGAAVLKGLAMRSESKPRLIRALETQRIAAVTAGHAHSACVDSHGKVFLFGGGRFYQLGFSTDLDSASPRELQSVRGATQVACGGLHTLAALHGGSLKAWGANQHGCLGFGSEGPQQGRSPTPIPGLLAAQVTAGWKHSAAVTPDGRLHTWGWGGSQGSAVSLQEGGSGGGQLGQGNEFDYWSPTHVGWLQTTSAGEGVPQLAAGGEYNWRVLQAACGLNHTAAVVEVAADVAL